MESLKGSMFELMAQFQERMSKFESELQKTSSTPAGSTSGIAADFAMFKCGILEAVGNLQQQLEALAHAVDALEMRGRRKMLLIHGEPEQPKEDTARVVLNVVRDKLQLKDATTDVIKRCHRLGRHPVAGKPRAILVKFSDRDVRDKIWFAKTKLKGSGITLSEFLTRSRHQVFMAAREKFGITNCWTAQGHVYIMTPDGTRRRIHDFGDIKRIAVPEPETDKPPAAASKKKRTVVKK